MNPRRRRQLSLLFAVVAAAALAGRALKGYYRGASIQTHVRPLGDR